MTTVNAVREVEDEAPKNEGDSSKESEEAAEAESYEGNVSMFNARYFGNHSGLSYETHIAPLAKEFSSKIGRPIAMLKVGDQLSSWSNNPLRVRTNYRAATASWYNPIDDDEKFKDTLFIWFNTSPNPNSIYSGHSAAGSCFDGITSLQNINGFPVSYNWNPTQEMFPLQLERVGENTLDLGYAFEDDAFIAYDIHGYLTLKGWEQFFSYLEGYYGGKGSTIPEKIAERNRIIEEKSVEIYAELCMNRNKAKIKEVESNIRSLDRSISQENNTLSTLLRSRTKYQDEFDAAVELMKKKEGLKPKYMKEFEVLKKNVSVEKVLAKDSGTIEVYTKPLETLKLADGSTRDLGAFKITFNVESGELPLIKALEKKSDWGDHPHQPNGESMCWGNMGPAVSKMNAEYEFAHCAAVIIRFLVQPNADDAYGRNVWRWPVASLDDGRTANLEPDYVNNEEDDEEDIEYCVSGEHPVGDGCYCCQECNDGGYECFNYEDCDEENGCPCRV